MAVDRARVIDSDNNAWVEVTLHEGKQHEVKRLLEAVGHPVSKLRRVAIGPVTARGLEPGQFRALLPEEIEGLRRGRPADAASCARRAAPAAVPAGRPSPRAGSGRAPAPTRRQPNARRTVDGRGRLAGAGRTPPGTPRRRRRRGRSRRTAAPAPKAARDEPHARRRASCSRRTSSGLDRFEPGKPIGGGRARAGTARRRQAGLEREPARARRLCASRPPTRRSPR